MDLSKKKKKRLPLKPQVGGQGGFHFYRSADFNAPFSKWQRLTESPVKEAKFTDRFDEDDDTLYYYKMTKVDRCGVEGEPQIVDGLLWRHTDGTRTERDLSKETVGYHVYRSTDAELPLDQWQRMTLKPMPTNETFVTEDIKPGVTYYYYVRGVNALGEEGVRSAIETAAPKE
jgi:hypothetical protein